MGKFEVLSYLAMLRQTGDHEYRRYADVHAELRVQGQSYSYTSVWRSLNSLFCDRLVEVVFETDGLQRTAKFRARLPTRKDFAQEQRVDNIVREPVGASHRATHREPAARRRDAPVQITG